jgi:catalase
MQMQQPKGRVAYEPQSLVPDSPRETKEGYRSFAAEQVGEKSRIRPESFADHYSQARLFYRSQTEPEQTHIASALVFELSKVEVLHVRQAVVGHLIHVDDNLAQRVAAGLGLSSMPPAPRVTAPVRNSDPSAALQIIGKMKDTLEGRCVGILVSDGSDGRAVSSIKKAALDAGATVKIVAPKIGGVKIADGSALAADGQLAGTPSVFFDAVAVLLTATQAEALGKDGAAVGFVRDAFGHLKAIAVDEGGQALLVAAGIKPDEAVIAASNLKAFVAAAKTRQWGREPSVRTLA